MAETWVSVSRVAEEAIREGSFEAGEWIEQKWWERFDDLVLTGLIERSIRSSPTLAFARERLKAASQVALQKQAALYPELDLDAVDLWVHLSKDGFFRAYPPTIPAAVNDFYVGLSPVRI